MKLNQMRLWITGVAALAIGIYSENGLSGTSESGTKNATDAAVSRSVKWLVSTQGKDGGWGQDGGETSYVRQGEHLESSGNDVANTAVAVLALLHAGNTVNSGPYRAQMQSGLGFILKHVEQSPADGLAVTDRNGTQIERKLGPYIDTFLTSKLLAELDGGMGSATANARVRQALQKCVAKIEKNQSKDGSWNVSGGWAPILGTSMASQSLAIARAKGAANPQMALNKVEQYTVASAAATPVTGSETAAIRTGGSVRGGVAGGIAGGVPGGVRGGDASSAGVALYKNAQELEQLSRTDADRKKNSARIQMITSQLSDGKFVTGFGSIGGEEFFSWLNISDSLHRAAGPEWQKWNGEMTAKLLKLQNEDGTWAGHHCITGRVAVTGAAVLLLTSAREPVAATGANTIDTSLKKK